MRERKKSKFRHVEQSQKTKKLGRGQKSLWRGRGEVFLIGGSPHAQKKFLRGTQGLAPPLSPPPPPPPQNIFCPLPSSFVFTQDRRLRRLGRTKTLKTLSPSWTNVIGDCQEEQNIYLKGGLGEQGVSSPITLVQHGAQVFEFFFSPNNKTFSYSGNKISYRTQFVQCLFK